MVGPKKLFHFYYLSAMKDPENPLAMLDVGSLVMSSFFRVCLEFSYEIEFVFNLDFEFVYVS